MKSKHRMLIFLRKKEIQQLNLKIILKKS